MKIHGTHIEVTREDYRAVLDISSEAIKRLKVPKNKKNKIGIAIALKTEDIRDRKKMENELFSELTRYLLDSNKSGQFYVYKFNDVIAEKINSDTEAKELLIRSRGHFMLHGSVVQRKIRDKNNYVFKLHGIIRHKPIQHIIREQFQREFSELLPSKIQFLMADEGIYFELTREWIGYVIKYIVGIAAFVSGDIRLAGKLYKELEMELADLKDRKEIPVIAEILNRLPLRIIEVLTVYLESSYCEFVSDRNVNEFLRSENIVREIKSIDSLNYKARLQSAIIYFLKNDVGSAIEELEGKNNNLDATWRYSLGFLYAYKGDISKALDNYKKVFHSPVSDNVCLDSEAFISDTLSKEPNKIQLHFFSGVLNYKIKKDYDLAKRDFNDFIGNNGYKKFPELKNLIEKYLGQIKNLGLQAN